MSLKCTCYVLGLSGLLLMPVAALANKDSGQNEIGEQAIDSTEDVPAQSDKRNRDEFSLQSRSTTIALTSDDKHLVVVNRQNNSVSIIGVRDKHGNDMEQLIAEIPVGKEPRFVAVSPNDEWVLVTNGADGTVSVIDLKAHSPTVIAEIPVGTEPRGIALTPNGKYAFVANHTSGDVSVISTKHWNVINTVPTGGNPQAIAISNDGDRRDKDEIVYVTRFFGELIDPARPDGFDDAKQGVIDAFKVRSALRGRTRVKQATLPPVDSGFAADRRQFCLKTRQVLQGLQNDEKVVFFNSGADGQGDGAAALANEEFCPDPDSHDAAPDGPIANTPQGVYPNFLYSALIRGKKLFVLNVGAQPEPPVKFNVNVQALVGVIDRNKGRAGKHAFTLNLNQQIAQEDDPADPAGSLQRAFLNDVVAMDADLSGSQFFILSRGGNYLLRAEANDAGELNIGAPNHIVRLQTGNIPSGVVIDSKATRAYTNNEVNSSVTSIDLAANQILTRDISSSAPPAPGTVEHRNLLGQLLFFTALGIPDVLDTDSNGQFDIAIRDIDPVQFRNKASKDAWSSCSSCHEDGHMDNVTWLFPTGPRQTIQLEGTFALNDLTDQRIMNWNAVRGAPSTDFDQNSRAIQGGIGHAADVNGEDRKALIFNHGPVVGVSDALDAMHEWIATVRAPNMPDVADAHQGRTVFAQHCASCHGGVKWTKSRTSPLYLNNPTFDEDPIGAGFFDGVLPRDPRVTVAGPQIVSVTDDNAGTLVFLDNVGTLDPDNPLEIRGAGVIAGQSTQGFPSLSAKGAFNVPSLLGVGLSAPYLHDGIAQNLEDVFAVHKLGDETIKDALSQQEKNDLLILLNSIDDDTAPFVSDADNFLGALLP